MKTKQDYLNLLNETVSYYTTEKNERSIKDGGCFYYKDGNMCAVGRCLIKPQNKDRLLDENGQDSGINDLLAMFSQRVFKKEYRGFKTEFWEQLQELHDSYNIEYWKDFKLTDLGKLKVEVIKDWINKFV